MGLNFDLKEEGEDECMKKRGGEESSRSQVRCIQRSQPRGLRSHPRNTEYPRPSEESEKVDILH